MNILHLDSSILSANSVSRTLTADLVAAQKRAHPEAVVTYRDLAVSNLQHLSAAHLAASQGQAVGTDVDVEVGKAVLAEFLAADVIVIGAPMYNFSVPSQLKAWIDRVSVAGVTFKYTPTGVEGLIKGKRVLVASTRGGAYANTPYESLDHQEAYLRAFFGFIGVTDVSFVRAENVSRQALREESIAHARAEAAALAA